MCGSQYSSLLKRSENIKGKFEDSLDCLCVRDTSAPWSVAPRHVISTPHITAPTPRVYFCKKLQKGHICEILSRKELNCKKKIRPCLPLHALSTDMVRSCWVVFLKKAVCYVITFLLTKCACDGFWRCIQPHKKAPSYSPLTLGLVTKGRTIR